MIIFPNNDFKVEEKPEAITGFFEGYYCNKCGSLHEVCDCGGEK